MSDLISCLMPTANRRAFVSRAIGYFLRQDYEPKELIILDDGSDPVADLAPPDPRIRYVRLEQRLSLGAKRNRCVELARGDLLMHWDDDDWHAPNRIALQIAALRAAGAELCGLRQMLFYEPATDRTWLYSYPAGQRPWLAGGSLLYTRACWRRAPFPDVPAGEDTRFVWARDLARAAVPTDHRFYVALIHPGNTSPKHRAGACWRPWAGDLRAIVGADLDDLRQFPSAPTPAAPSESEAPMRLNLGCCDRLLPGYINVDVVEAPGVAVADLRDRWPWPDSAVEHVRAHDIIEHLPDKIHTMNELWRVLAPGATAEIAVPTTDGPGAFQDPTHVSFWNRRSFLYYEHGNPYRERFARFYGISARFRVVSERLDRTPDGPRLTITLQAVKL
ncbi:MAG: glycosyltransferase [Chloroflexaceae bacterium]|nr:glycosyltransferase [Chloroflexaceae bacterium]